MSKFFNHWFLLCICAGLLFALCLAGELFAQSSPIIFNDNAGWNWCQDERAIIYNNKFIFGSTADASGTGGASRDGDVEITTYDPSTSELSRFTLHDALDSDDHAPPALMVRPDGRILAVYCTHGHDGLVRYRITTNPGDTSSWSAESTFNANTADSWGATYSNVYRLSSSGITYDFYRGEYYNPNVLVSTDDGSSWSTGGRLIRTTTSGVRPYVKYITNDSDRVWFVYTQHHPRNAVTNLYAAYLQGGTIYDSYGTQIGILDATSSSGIAPSQGTVIFDAAAHNDNRAWTSDLQLDASGNPVAIYSVRVNNDDHRYRFARFDGATWHDNEIAYAGQCLYTAENDYVGLIAFNSSDLNTVYMSANADPVSGAPLISSADGRRHWEVYRGFTNNNGASFTWTPITANSTFDNIRPNLPSWDSQNTALYWLQGTYTTYTNYDLDAVGYIFSGANGIWSSSGGGDWASGGNWQSGLIASGKLGIADFSTLDVSGTVSVQLNGSRTLGTLVFGDTNAATPGNWVLDPGSGGTITLENIGAARPVITVQNQTATINVPLAGTQGLEKNGNGTLVLNLANTYTGDTAIISGTLKPNAVNVIPHGSGNGNVAISSGATLDLNGYNQSINGLSGAGTVDNTVTGSVTLTVGGNNTSSTLSGKIQNTTGTLGINKIGNGTLTLSGVNTYSGLTTIAEGVLKIGGALPVVAHRWSFNNSLADSIGGSNATIVNAGSNDVTLSSTQATLTGGARSSSDYIRLGSNLLPDSNEPIALELWATPRGLQSWSRIFDLGSSDTENLFMSWTKDTDINTDKVGWKHGATYSYSENTNQPYNLNTEYHIVLVLNPVGESTEVTWYSTSSGSTSLGPAKGSFITTNNLAGFLDNEDNLGRSFYTADGTASASYNEVRFWSGTFDSNILEILHDAGPDADLNSLNIGGSLPSTTALNLSGSTATLDLNGLDQTVASLSGVAGSSLLLGAGTLTVGGSGTSTTFSGNISGTGGLVKNGAGTLSLAGDLIYSGLTDVENGALRISGDVVDVGPVAINGGSLLVNSLSASMQDVAGPGALTVGDGSVAAQLTADSVAVGSLTIGAGATLTIRSFSAGDPLTDAANLQAVPEPSTWIILAIAGATAVLIGRRRNRDVSSFEGAFKKPTYSA